MPDFSGIRNKAGTLFQSTVDKATKQLNEQGTGILETYLSKEKINSTMNKISEVILKSFDLTTDEQDQISSCIDTVSGIVAKKTQNTSSPGPSGGKQSRTRKRSGNKRNKRKSQRRRR